MNKNSIGLAIMIYNEEKAIPGWLDSVQQYISQIEIAVDDRTNDETYNLLDKYELNYFKYTFDNDFSKAINLSLDKLQTDWAFALAPDERINQEHAHLIPQLIEYCEKNNIDAVSIPRRHWYDLKMENERKEWFPDYQMRFFKVSKGIRFFGKIHEMPKGYSNAISFNDIEIQHFNLCEEFCNAEKWAKKNALYRSLGG